MIKFETNNYNMEKSELRIGNFVNAYINASTGKVYSLIKVTCLHMNTLEGEQNVTYPYNLIEPIHITEEWLFKFGFKRNDNTKVSDSFYWIMVGGSQLHINPDNGVVWIHRDENIFNNPCLVKHVHQLQNLYYALTGVELSVS